MTGTFRGLSSGLGFAAATAGIASVGLALRDTVRASLAFESSFAGVRKTVDATEPELQALAAGFRSMSKQIPVSVQELNAIGEAAGQLGIRKGAILDFTRTVADLGATTNLASDQAANALARIANITGLPQGQFDRLGATIVELGNKLAATESEIVDMSLRLAGAGSQIGLTEDQITSLAGALSSVGVNAEAGGSAFSRVFATLATDVASGGANLERFARVAGQTAADFKRQFERDAAGAVVSFIEGLDRVNQQGGNVFAVLKQLGLGEIRVRDALLRAAGAGDLFRRSLEIGARAFRENNALNAEAAKRYGTSASQLQVFSNRVNDLQITLGDALAPALLDIVKPLGEWAEKTKNQQRLQRGLNQAVSDARSVFQGLRDVLVPLADGVRATSERFGGLRIAVELALTAMVAAKVVAFATSISGLGAASRAARGNVNALRFALLRLGAIGVITLGIAVLMNKGAIQDSVDRFLRRNRLGFLTGERIELPVGLNSGQLRTMRDQIADLKGESDLAVRALDKLVAKVLQAEAAQSKRPDDRAGPRGPGAIAASNAAVTKKTAEGVAKAEEGAAKAVAAAKGRAAQGTKRAAAAAQRALERQREAFSSLLENLGLASDRAAATKGLRDDLRVAQQTLSAIGAQIKVEGRTAELLRQQLAAEQQVTDLRKQIADNRRAAQAARQFRALGLSETGGERTPSAGTLGKRLAALKDQVKGSFLDTGKTRAQLQQIAKVLRGAFGKVGADVRSAIKQMLDDIAGALRGGTEGQAGPLTKFAKTGVGELLKGVGLTPEQVKELRSRFAQVGPGGSVPQKGFGAFGMAFPSAAVAAPVGGGEFVVYTTVNLDGREIAVSTTRHQQRTKGRTAGSRRGTRAGR